MGNILCKNRVNHSNNPKSPVDRVLGRCAQICPKSLGKQKQFWDKQVLETSPPLQNQPKTDNSGWNSASLTVPDSSQADGVDHPVAPPRKKRPSMLRKDDPPVRNGFKDIFSGNRSESTTTSDSQGDAKDFTDFEKVPLNRGSAKEREKEKLSENTMEKSVAKSTQKLGEKPMETPRTTVMEITLEKPIEKEVKLEMEEEETVGVTESIKSSEDPDEADDPLDSKTNSLSNKALKVGNKKSDKFFGENLSDSLSDVPMVQEVEEEILKIQQAMLQPPSKDSEFEEAEDAIKQQLLASLSTYKDVKVDESIDEPDRVAVEEPIITKVVITRHVCDDEDELREHLHKDHDYDHTYVVPDPNAPKKPQRDFTKYKKQNEESAPAKGDYTERSTEGSDALDLLSQIQKELPPSNSILMPKTKEIASVDVVDSSVSEDAANLVAVISESLAKGKNENTAKEMTEKLALEPVSEPLIEKMSQSEEVLRSELSTQSFLTADMMEHIAQQVTLAEDYQPEDFSSSNDGSEIAPNSKLIKKRSLSSQTSYVDKQNKHAKSPKQPTNAPTTPLIIQKFEVRGSHDEEPTTDTKEPETPPVFYKLTRPSPLLASNEPNQESTGEKSVTKKRKPQEVQAKIQISPESVNEDISKAIKSFMEQDALPPENVLALLEEEFGELLHVSSLPREDQKLIDDLRNAVKTKTSVSDEVATGNTSEVLAELTVESNVSEIQVNPKIILQVASEDAFKDEPKETPEVNASIVTIVPSTTSRALSEDKRRHSIDEFDHWFAGGLSMKAEAPIRKRKREASLPGCLFTGSSAEEMGTFKQRLNINKERSKDDTDDVLNKPHATVVTTTAIHIFDPIPESIRPASPAPHKTDITIITLNPNSENEHENLDVARTQKIETNNNPGPAIVRGQKNRSSVGHSLLLKFLDIERSNSFK